MTRGELDILWLLEEVVSSGHVMEADLQCADDGGTDAV